MHELTILSIVMAVSAGVLAYWEWGNRSPKAWQRVPSAVAFLGLGVVAFLVISETVDEFVFWYAGTPLLFFGAVTRTLLELLVRRRGKRHAIRPRSNDGISDGL